MSKAKRKSRSRRNPFGSVWYARGLEARKSGRYIDRYDAWELARGKPSTSDEYVVAMDSFYQGYKDAVRINPASVIPLKWTAAKVRVNAKGQVQVALPMRRGKNPAARRASGLRVIKVTPPYAWGAGKSGKSWIIVDRDGKQASGFYTTKKIAMSHLPKR